VVLFKLLSHGPLFLNSNTTRWISHSCPDPYLTIHSCLDSCVLQTHTQNSIATPSARWLFNLFPSKCTRTMGKSKRLRRTRKSLSQHRQSPSEDRSCRHLMHACVLCARGWRTRACCVRVGGEQCTRAHFVMNASHISANSFEQSRQQSACDYAAIHATHGAVLVHTVTRYTCHAMCATQALIAFNIILYSSARGKPPQPHCAAPICPLRCGAPTINTSILVIVSCCYGNAKHANKCKCS
jgi:hypothetical protein